MCLPHPQIEFIIRRVPHGKVFALKRETEGQPLGVIREGNTAEIKEVRLRNADKQGYKFTLSHLRLRRI